MRMEKIINAMCGDVWCIHPDKLEAICEVLNVRLAGGYRSDAEIKAAVAQAKENVSTTVKAASGMRNGSAGANVAVLTLYGTLAQRTGAWDSGAVSVERFSKNFDEALNDSSVGSIVLDIDSPGGSVFGIEEMAEKIYKARGRKKIVAVANSFAASAAYWIAAAADELVVTPGGEVGSIGVFCLHQDLSGAYQQIGVKHTIIKAGEHKAEASPYEPLDPDAKNYIQERVNERYDVFTKAVARFRKVSVSEVRENFGQGRMKMAKAAVKSKMADAIGTLESVVADLVENKNKSFGAKASDKSNESCSDKKEKTMADDVKTAEAGIDADAVKAEATEAAKAAEQKRCSDLQAAFPDDPAFAIEQITAGASVLEAKAAYCDVLTERNEKLQKSNSKKSDTGSDTEGAPPLAGNNEGSNSSEGEDFMTVAREMAEEKGISVSKAMSIVAHKQPELHEAFLGRKK